MKKKLLSILLSLAMVVTMMPAMTMTAFATPEPETAPTKYNEVGGGTSAADPYLISTLAQLEDLADAVSGGNTMEKKYFKLIADIGSTEVPFTKIIGGVNGMTKDFKGNFDGDGHTVTVEINSTSSAGLFYSNLGMISNLTVAGSVTVTGTPGNNDAGGIANGNAGIISNCCNKAKITSGFRAGGISAWNQVDIINCHNEGEVSSTGGYASVGGCVAFLRYNGNIKNSYNSGSVSGSGEGAYVGGICGMMQYNIPQMINCYNAGIVAASGSGSVKGALVGVIYNDYAITNCYFDNSTLNMIGDGSDAKVTNCAALTTEQMKATTGTNLVDKLNSYISQNSSTTTGWLNWAVKSDVNGGYPYLKTSTEWGALGEALSAATPVTVDGLFTVTVSGSSTTIKLEKDFTAESGDETLTVAGTKTLDLNGHVHNMGTDDTTDDITFTAWKDATKLPDTKGNYYLDTDVTLSATWNVPAGTEQAPAVTNLCLNGFVIKQNGSDKSVIKVSQGATLNLYDCSTATVHNGYVDANGLWHLDATNEHNGLVDEKDITGGIITGGTGFITTGNKTVGGGVYINGGEVTMNGGTITGNTATQYGGGVFIASGSFTMKGGAVAYNKATSFGGGVSAFGGKFDMFKGDIIGNYGEAGGGVMINTGVTFTMADGTIKDNKAGSTGGGGVMLNTGSIMNMNGGTISGNITTGNGGGIYNLGALTVTGGTITGNTGGGGGVLNYGGYGTITLGGTAKITGNNGSNLFLYGSTADLAMGDNAPVTTDAGKGIMTVGVTVSPLGKFTTSGTEAQKACFFSDNPAYEVAFNEGTGAQGDEYLELVVIPPHTHDMGTPDDKTDDITFTAWTSDNSLPGSSDLTSGVGSFYLTKDVTLDATWTVPTGTVNLCLNGHVIKQTAQASVITVNSGATLNLYDCDTKTEHYFTVGNDGLWTITDTKTENTKTVKGGVITGGTGTQGNIGGTNGGGVFVDGGTLAMFGGNIVGNSVTSIEPIEENKWLSNGFGGGVFVDGGTLEMDGGAICGNAKTGYAHSGEGGGVMIKNGSFTLSGTSEIYGNTTWCGGGVEVSDNAHFNMTGGKITGNTASGEGAAAGGVEVAGENASFTMTDGMITGNTATGDDAYAGGVELYGGSLTLGGKAQITGNTANSVTNNVYLSDQTITLGTKTEDSEGNGVAEPVTTGETIMQIGVTVEKGSGQFTTSGTKAQKDCFTSDSEDYIVSLNEGDTEETGDDYLELVQCYTVTFELSSHGESAPESQKVVSGGKATKPENPTDANYIFDGWYENQECTGNKYDFETAVTGDITLYAKWILAFAITNGAEQTDEATNHGYLTIDKTTAAANDTVTITIMASEGYQLKADSLKATYTDSNKEQQTIIPDATQTEGQYKFKMPAYAVAVEAEFETLNCTINYKDQGDTEFSGTHGENHPTTHTYGTETTLVDPTKAGYTFGGWYTTKDCTGDAVTKLGATSYDTDITLYAQWTINKHEVDVTIKDTKGGSVDKNQIQNVDWNTSISVNNNVLTIGAGDGAKTVTATPDTGYEFDKWTMKATGAEGEGSEITAESKVTGNTTVVAHFKLKTYDVTFNMKGHGTEVTKQEVEHGSKATAPDPAPTATGYTFGGWYKNEACTKAWNFGADTVTDNIMLYARWIENEVPLYAIQGKVEEEEEDSPNNIVVPNAKVQLLLGTKEIDWTVTDDSGNYTFGKVENGIYNIVVTKAEYGKTKTALVTVSDGNATVDVVLPSGDVNSIVEHKGEEVEGAKSSISQAVVGGLDEIAAAAADEDNIITIKLKVEPKAEEYVVSANEIKNEAGSGKKVEFIDMSLLKRVNNGQETSIGDDNNTLLTIVIPFDFTTTDVNSVMILRKHGKGKAEKLTKNPAPENEGYKVDEIAGTITIYAMKFSDYAIAYDDLNSYSVSAQNDGHGTATVKIGGETVTEADKDASVVFTATPNSGYEFDYWEVVEGGISLVKQKQNPITITMPDKDLTLKAHFKKQGGGWHPIIPIIPIIPIGPIVPVDKYYTVSFDMQGIGDAIDPITVQKGSKLAVQDTPVAEGYEFGGWFKDAECINAWDFEKDTVQANMTLYAKWTKIVEPEEVSVLLVKGAKSGDKAIKLSWNKVDGATKYVVYGNSCGKNVKKLKTTTGKTYTVKKIAGKKLTAHKVYKFYVVAYTPDGKVKSKTIHFITANTKGKYANVKSIKAKKTSLQLAVGEFSQVGATYKMYSGKKHLGKEHGKALRYISNCPEVASVSSTGKVLARQAGTATIYIQDVGGKYCKTTVTVK